MGSGCTCRSRRAGSPRCLYEQARKTKFFELKMAAAYAGKTEVAPGRYKRGGLCLTCADEGADMFRDHALPDAGG